MISLRRPTAPASPALSPLTAGAVRSACNALHVRWMQLDDSSFALVDALLRAGDDQRLTVAQAAVIERLCERWGIEISPVFTGAIPLVGSALTAGGEVD